MNSLSIQVSELCTVRQWTMSSAWCVCGVLLLVVLQYQEAVSKRVEDEKQCQKLCAARVRQTEVLVILLQAVCSGAALLLPCIVIHLTQVSGSCRAQPAGGGSCWVVVLRRAVLSPGTAMHMMHCSAPCAPDFVN